MTGLVSASGEEGREGTVNRFSEEGRTPWRELSSFAHTDVGVSVGFPSRVRQVVELGRK